jgi:hypothetical protein
VPRPDDDAPPPEAPVAEKPGVAAVDTEYAVKALVKWVSRPTRTQWVALALVSSLALGPLVALVFILGANSTPVRVVQPAPLHGPETTSVTVTALGVNPTAGELRVRVLLNPAQDFVDDTGRLTTQVTLSANDVSGNTIHTFDVGQTPAPFEISAPILEGSVAQYPFDSYRAPLLLAVATEEGERQVAEPAVVEARSTIDDFTVTSETDASEAAQAQPENLLVVGWNASRPATTIGYAVWLMVLMWALAATGLLIVWAVLIWRVEMPFWGFGYFVGVLFALPPLRDSLPGRPPPGTLFDFGSYYWAIALVATTLIMVLGIWIRQARTEAQLRALGESPRE